MTAKSAMASDQVPEPWVSIDVVAAHVGVRKDSIYRWIERRGLPATKVGKLWKLKLSEVDAWMRSRRHHGGQVSTRGAQDTSRALASRLVLVVDDEKPIRDTVCEFVVDQGHEVQAAADGEEAMALLGGTRQFDLVILDLKMPGLDGWDFRERQMRDPKLARIPVIVVTAARDANVDGAIVLKKPLRLDALASAMAKLLGASRDAVAHDARTP